MRTAIEGSGRGHAEGADLFGEHGGLVSEVRLDQPHERRPDDHPVRAGCCDHPGLHGGGDPEPDREREIGDPARPVLEQVRERAVEHTWGPTREGRTVPARLEPLPPGRDLDHPDLRIGQGRGEGFDRVRPPAHAGHEPVGDTPEEGRLDPHDDRVAARAGTDRGVQ